MKNKTYRHKLSWMEIILHPGLKVFIKDAYQCHKGKARFGKDTPNHHALIRRADRRSNVRLSGWLARHRCCGLINTKRDISKERSTALQPSCTILCVLAWLSIISGRMIKPLTSEMGNVSAYHLARFLASRGFRKILMEAFCNCMSYLVEGKIVNWSKRVVVNVKESVIERDFSEL